MASLGNTTVYGSIYVTNGIYGELYGGGSTSSSSSSTGGGGGIIDNRWSVYEGNTEYYILGAQHNGPTETNVVLPAPVAGTFSNLFVYCTSASSGTVTMTLRVNQSDTSLSLSVGSTGSASNTSDSVSVAQGDLLAMKVVGGGNADSTSNGQFGLYFLPD